MKRFVVNGKKAYKTLEAAVEAANVIYRKTGCIVSVDEK
jgi:hypothetical protein